MALSDLKQRFQSTFQSKGLMWGLGVVALAITVVLTAIGMYWSDEPDLFDVKQQAFNRAKKTDLSQLPSGYVYANTLAHIAETLLYKPGGYITNDVTPPGVLLDNITSWEAGCLIMLRDGATALRNHFARSQSQSAEDPDLAVAEPFFYYQSDSWALPSTEVEYQKGIDALLRYMHRLTLGKNQSRPAIFYSRADNLRQYFEVLEKRLGAYSTRLSASSKRHVNVALKMDSESTVTQTSWWDIDNVFYEARGATWALVHILKAIEYEFQGVLNDKHALETYRRMIHELENGLSPVLSPIILNGDGFGIFANHSLTLATYITRANAAALDLRDIMMQG